MSPYTAQDLVGFLPLRDYAAGTRSHEPFRGPQGREGSRDGERTGNPKLIIRNPPSKNISTRILTGDSSPAVYSQKPVRAKAYRGCAGIGLVLKKATMQRRRRPAPCWQNGFGLSENRPQALTRPISLRPPIIRLHFPVLRVFLQRHELSLFRECFHRYAVRLWE